MRTLAAVNAAFAAALLLFGLVALAAVGVTGLIFIVPSLVFALLAAMTHEGSRLAVLLTLSADSLFSYIAAGKFITAWTHEAEARGLASGKLLVFNAFTIEMTVSIAILILVSCCFIAVTLDWARLSKAKWFKPCIATDTREVRPNPSLKLTCYGMRRKPGLQHASYHCSPGLHRMPPQAA